MAPLVAPVSKRPTQAPSVSPSKNNGIPVVATTSLMFQLQSVPGPLTDLTTDAFLAACSKFYDQELPDCATDVKCELSIRRLLQQGHDSKRVRALQMNIDVPVDVTATFEGTFNATVFDDLISQLAETNSDEFIALLKASSSNAEVISYFLFPIR